MGSNPIFENDHYRYIWEGKVIASGENPYLHFPNSTKLDHIDYDKRHMVGYPSLSSIYPPLSQIWFLLVSPFEHKHALFILQVLSLIILIWIIPFWFKESDNYFLLILPFLLKEFVQSVHIDLLAVFFFTLAINKTYKHSFLILSFLTKVLSALYLPYLFLKRFKEGRSIDFKSFIIPGLLIIFLFINHSESSGSSEFIKRWKWNSFPMNLLVGGGLDLITSRFIMLGLFILSYLYFLKRVVFNKAPRTLLYSALFLFSPVVHPWYLIWFLPLVSTNKTYYIYIFTSVVAYMPYGCSPIQVQIGTALSYAVLAYATIKDLKKKKSVICIFAKTPDLSNVKTRLAKSIGKDKATEIFERSLKVTLSEVSKLDLDYKVAVAEEKSMAQAYWRDHPTVYQGGGDLGERLSRVYNYLIKDYDSVFFIGADSPHIDFKALKKSIDSFIDDENDFLLGPALDGGYYIFGGKAEISRNIWKSVPYSQDNTFSSFQKLLGTSVTISSEEFDLDDENDLKRLKSLDISKLSSMQKGFIDLIGR